MTESRQHRDAAEDTPAGEVEPEGEVEPQDTVEPTDEAGPEHTHRSVEPDEPMTRPVQADEEPMYQTDGWRVALVAALILAAGLFFSWPLTFTIIGVVAMITIHELGHFLAAKWAGMKVTEFFIGFGPRIWSFRRGETEYGIKPIPAGAYVRIIGMNNLDEVAPADEARAYRQQSFPKRLIVVLAGPATHFIQAMIIVFMLLAVAGVPGGKLTAPPANESKTWVVNSVTEDSGAAAAGLQAGDKVVAYNDEPVATFKELTDAISKTTVGDEVALTVERDGRRFETEAEIGGRPAAVTGPGDTEGSPFLGIGPDANWTTEKLGVFEAIAKTPGQTAAVSWEAISALGHFFSPSGLGDFADTVSEGGGGGEETTSQPSSGSSEAKDSGDEGRLLSIVGAVRLGADLGAEGWAGFAIFFLSINIFVGLLNLVPLLPFDGGHAAVAIYERIRSRGGERYHADVAKLLPVAYAVVMGLVVLGVTTLYLDIVNPVDF